MGAVESGKGVLSLCICNSLIESLHSLIELLAYTLLLACMTKLNKPFSIDWCVLKGVVKACPLYTLMYIESCWIG